MSLFVNIIFYVYINIHIHTHTHYPSFHSPNWLPRGHRFFIYFILFLFYYYFLLFFCKISRAVVEMSLYVCAWLSEGVVDAFAWGVVAHQGLFLICLTKSFSPHCQLYKCKSYCQISSKRSLWSSLHSDSYSLYSLLIGSLTLSFQRLADVGVNTARQSGGWTCGFLA